MVLLKKHSFQILILILLSIATKMDGQIEDYKSRKYLFIKEEFPITEKEITEFENSKNLKLPDDYRHFLLNYNGGYPIQKDPENVAPFERFYSLGDLKLGVIFNQKEIEEYVKEDIEERYQKLKFEKLIFIGKDEMGYIHIYLGKENYGSIFHSNFFGGEGLEKTSYSSFTAFMENIQYVGLNDEIEFKVYGKKLEETPSNKIFTFDSFYWEDDIKEQSLERFKEVLKFYGHPNKEYTTYYSTRTEKKDVITHYINNPIILEYLLSIGGTLPIPIKDLNNIESLKILHRHNANLKGVLCSTRNLEIIKYLIIECNQDMNESFKGEYPLINMTKIYDSYTDYGNIQRYERLLKIFDLGIDIDLSIKDDKGNTLKERIEIFKKEYEKSKKKYEEYQN